MIERSADEKAEELFAVNDMIRGRIIERQIWLIRMSTAPSAAASSNVLRPAYIRCRHDYWPHRLLPARMSTDIRTPNCGTD